MAPCLIFGAGGKGVGRQIAQLAIAKKRPVIVVVRNKQSAEALEAVGAQVFIGDACDSEVVKAACHAAGTTATVISTMGGVKII